MNRVMKHKVEGIEGAYCVISHQYRDNKDLNRRDYFTNQSYFLDLGNGFAVEWEPTYGPFTLLTEVDKDHEDAMKHWFFDYCDGYGNWAQGYVDDCGIKEHLLTGDLQEIFKQLRSFGEDNIRYLLEEEVE